MFSCHKTVRLASQSMDTPLPLGQRVAVRVHLLYCSWCRRYAKQLAFMRDAVRRIPEQDELAPDLQLGEEARQRIRQRLRESIH